MLNLLIGIIVGYFLAPYIDTKLKNYKNRNR
jgi:uncharacterized protein YneF (UPF0154 family)